MLPTVFASYRQGEVAERLVGALLESGVAPEDISVVIRRNGGGKFGETTEGLQMVDSGEAGNLHYGHTAIQTEGSYIHESKVGGGISTSESDDEVSSVEEMDDSQEVAEDMSYPASARSYSSQERFDMAQGANTGFFNTTKPGPEGLGRSNPFPEFESEISSVLVPHMGLALGDGALATEVMGAGVADNVGGTPAADMQDYLEDQGVPADLAFMLNADFQEGGAVVAIATPPGGLDYDAIQQVLEDSGARNVQLVEAKD